MKNKLRIKQKRQKREAISHVSPRLNGERRQEK